MDLDHHAAWLTSVSIFWPISRSAVARSYLVWRFIQNLALLPKYRDKRKADSAEIPRLPFIICVMRPEGTRRARASLLAESPRATISHLRIRPGCIGFIVLSFVIIDNFYIVCIAVFESKADAPGAINSHRPLFGSIKSLKGQSLNCELILIKIISSASVKFAPKIWLTTQSASCTICLKRIRHSICLCKG